MLAPQCQEWSIFPKANLIFPLKSKFPTPAGRKIGDNQFIFNRELFL